MRRIDSLVLVLVLLLIGGILASPISCRKAVPSEQTPKLSEELNIYNWWDYFAPTTIEDFEREFAVKVNLDTYEDEEVMLSVVQSNPGRYDLVFPTESLVGEMIQLKLLEPLNLDHIPNIVNVDSRFLDLPYDPGNQYSIPYLWGTTGIAVNTKYVTEKVDSWGILWDSRYSGRIGMLNNMYAVIGLTLKYLGYSLNTTNPAELEEARVKLLEQRPLLQGYLDPETYIGRLISGELWLAQAYNGDALAAREDNPDITFVIPKEGSDYYMDCMAIPRGAPHKYSAEVFINFVLRPEVHARIANYNRYACPNRAAIDSKLIDPELLGDPAIYPPPKTLIKLESWEINLGPAEAVYNRIWAELQRKKQ